MKKNKKCFRSVVGITEPEDCIKEKCMAWVKIGGMGGCAFILEAVTSLIDKMGDDNKKEEEKTNDSDGKDDTQSGEGGTDGTDTGGEEPTASDTNTQDTEVQVKGSEVPKEVTPLTTSADATFHHGTGSESAEATLMTIEDGEYKGDPTQ